MPLDASEYAYNTAVRTGNKKKQQQLAREALALAQVEAAAGGASRENVESQAVSEGILTEAVQNASGNFGSEGLSVGAENIADLQQSGSIPTIGADTGTTNSINLDEMPEDQLQEITGLASQLGLNEEQLQEALNTNLTQQNVEQSFSANAGLGGNVQNFVNSSEALQAGQQATAGKELSPEQILINNLAALGPNAYKEVDLNDEIQLYNLSNPLSMLSSGSEKGQQNMLKDDPMEKGWADVIGQDILPKVIGGMLTLATAGGATPLGVLGAGGGSTLGTTAGMAVNALGQSGMNTLQTGGSLTDFAKGAALNAATSYGSNAIGDLASGIDLGGGFTEKLAQNALGSFGKGAIDTGLRAAFGEDVDVKDALLQAGIDTAMGTGLDVAKDTDLFKSFADAVAPDTTGASTLAPTALEVGASPGDIGTAGSGAPITVDNLAFQDYMDMNVGYGLGAGSIQPNHPQFGLAKVDPTGPGLNDTGGQAIPQNPIIQSPTGDEGGLVEGNLPSAGADPDMFAGITDDEFSSLYKGPARPMIGPWGYSSFNVDPIAGTADMNLLNSGNVNNLLDKSTVDTAQNTGSFFNTNTGPTLDTVYPSPDFQPSNLVRPDAPSPGTETDSGMSPGTRGNLGLEGEDLITRQQPVPDAPTAGDVGNLFIDAMAGMSPPTSSGGGMSRQGGLLSQFEGSTAGQYDPTSEKQIKNIGVSNVNPSLLSRFMEFEGLSDEERKRREKLWMVNPMIEGVG